MNKKGFTLVEILVVVIIIAILTAFYVSSHEKGVIIRKNEQATARFMELTNAARLHNEMYPGQRIAGGFGANASDLCTNCLNPCNLFEGFNDTENFQANISGYALNPKSWGLSSAADCSNSLRYEGYEYILCNPYFSGSQPDNTCSDDNNNARFAIMKSPAAGAGDFSGKTAWINDEYEISNNY